MVQVGKNSTARGVVSRAKFSEEEIMGTIMVI
ncbi:hypothetical protein MNBD_CPR01-252, partial [hydrothermal vent metagenome]